MTSKLLSQFNTLAEDEQNIVFALSIILLPIGQENFQRLLRQSNCFKPALINKIAKPLKDKLLQLKILENSREGWLCNADLADELIKIAAKQPFFTALAIETFKSNHYFYFNFLSIFRKIRLSVFLNNLSSFQEQLGFIEKQFPNELIPTLNRLFFKEFDEVWFLQLTSEIRFVALKTYLEHNQFLLKDCTLQYRLLETQFLPFKTKEIRQTLLEYRLVRGNFENAEAWLLDNPQLNDFYLLGALRFLQNKNTEALAYFNDYFNALKQHTRKRNLTISGLAGQFYHLSLLKTCLPENFEILKKQLAIASKTENDSYSYCHGYLLDTLAIYRGQMAIDKADYLLNYTLIRKNTPYTHLFQALALYWLDGIETLLKIDNTFLIQLAKHCKQAHQFGYKWYAVVSSLLLERLGHNDKQVLQISALYKGSPLGDIIDLLPKVEPWERALNALNQLNESVVTQEQSSRLIWLFSLTNDRFSLVPREQKMGKSGRWTKGKAVSLKRLSENLNEFDYLSEQDKQICHGIEVEYEHEYYGYGLRADYILGEKSLLAAVGHPHLYWAEKEDFTQPITIKVCEPQLLVKEKGANLHIFLLPTIKNNATLVLEKAANEGLLLYPVTKKHLQVAEILGKNGLLVPHHAKQQVIASITSIASTLTVQSDIGGQSPHAEEVAADSRLHIHLQPVNDGLQIEMYVQPFAEGGPIYKPATGGKTVLAEIDGKQLQTTRDFVQESAYLTQTLAACPQLYPSKEMHWLMDEPEMALEALLQLQELPEFVLLKWPKGKSIRISRVLGLSASHFSIRKENNWFSVEGQLQIADNQVLQMQHLLQLLKNSNGRFLKLDDGQVIALTQELRQRLDDFAGLGDLHQDKMRFHALAAHALEEVTQGMTIKAEKQWQAQVTRLQEMTEILPDLPSTFQGQLRDYQLEGYQWMCRLAHWGAGACLADDMGLGKTVQALALILSRANVGATLILAPTSVCMNWLEETVRFAPTLRVHQFGQGDRQQMLDDANAFDVVVCSYGLLQTEGERLAQKQWHTLVADEAQAIKNALTKRSKAVMALPADFKLITTGTPIENHLGELWNLFNFINPGLLGSLQKFNTQFASPIENNKDHGVQLRLKKLLRPFILRRLKTDVLTELPARTEVTLHVELSAEEQTFYEALRRDALDSMQNAKKTAAAGQQHLQVLAEIMRLRRACCHPRLVMPESLLGSSKLDAFIELVEELISNRHKALVFSQFVGHLSIIRELLDSKKIRYQYLDGSTPVPKRTQAVNAFQAGEGDLFLISLKAGGSGLNLTAADYVIHMDPWWNPAVEDQASDRAHRMGQQRPVTIYRLVAKDTIEDKIVALHKHKRDLAHNLLEGGELGGKMSFDEMLALISDVD